MPRRSLALALVSSGVALGLWLLGGGKSGAGGSAPLPAEGVRAAGEAPPEARAGPRASPATPPLEAVAGREDLPATLAPLAPGIPSAPLRGRVVYASTGQGVPCTAVALERGTFRETLRTGFDGSFSTASDLAPGPVWVDLFEAVRTAPWHGEVPERPHGLSPEAFEIEHILGGPEIVLSADFWPTCRVEVVRDAALRVRLSDLRLELADLGGSGLFECAGELLWRHGAGGRWSGVWMRDALPLLREQGPPWEIRCRDDSGTWSASALVDGVEGVLPRPVRLELEARAALLVRLGPRSRGPVHRESWRVELTAAGEAEPAREQRVGLIPGEALFELLAPGSYTVRAIGPEEEMVERFVTAEPAATTTVDLDLPRPRGPAIRGTVRSRTGRFLGEASVRVQRLDAASPPVEQRLVWQPDGEAWVAPYLFEHLPAGSFRVELQCDPFPADPPDAQIASPPAELDFVVLDDARRWAVAVRATDAAGGHVIPELDVELHGGSSELSWFGRATPGATLLEGVMEGGTLAWRIGAGGYRCAQGHTFAFDPSAFPGDEKKRVIAVLLERGPSATVILGAEGQPLEGATVLADGREAGTSGADGRLELFGPRPARIDVSHPEWRVPPREAWRLLGVLWGPCAEIEIEMERR